VGDFNDWNETATPMMRDLSAGLWRVRLELDRGREYQFRYLVDGSTWHNDWHADRYVPNIHGSDNSVVET
jgi:1,4-alpha-glucan branching enzyme